MLCMFLPIRQPGHPPPVDPWLSVTRLPGFWLYSEVRMQAFADILLKHLYMLYGLCIPSFLVIAFMSLADWT